MLIWSLSVTGFCLMFISMSVLPVTGSYFMFISVSYCLWLVLTSCSSLSPTACDWFLLHVHLCLLLPVTGSYFMFISVSYCLCSVFVWEWFSVCHRPWLTCLMLNYVSPSWLLPLYSRLCIQWTILAPCHYTYNKRSVLEFFLFLCCSHLR